MSNTAVGMKRPVYRKGVVRIFEFWGGLSTEDCRVLCSLALQDGPVEIRAGGRSITKSHYRSFLATRCQEVSTL